MRDDQVVDIVSAEPGVSVRRQHFENSVVQLQNRDVERASAEIVNRDFRSPVQLIEAVSQGRSGRFIDNALDRKTRDLAGTFCRAPLCVIKVRRHGDNCS